MTATPTTVTYLQMLSCTRPPVVLPPNVRTDRQLSPSAAEYRLLYNGVGGDYQWHERNLMEDTLLEDAVGGDRIHLHRLWVDDQLAGYSELSSRYAPDVEIVYFGLFPAFIGQGLGRLFLDWTVDHAWHQLQAKRVWVHTCDRDHSAALPNYLRAGFRIYHIEYPQPETSSDP